MQEAAKSVVRNTFVMMGAQLITWASSFVLILFLPKYLGSSKYGELYLAISIAMMFQVIIEFGGQYHITKEVSRSQESAPYILVNSAVTRIFLWALAILLMFEFSKLAGYALPVIILILILGTAKLWEGINSLLRNCYQGFELMEYPSIGSVAERAFLMITAIIALLAGAGDIIIAILMAASTFINFIISARFAKKIISFLPKIEFDKAKALLKQGVPYFMWSIFATIYYRIDVIMLSIMTTYSVVGWYGAAYRLFDVLMFFPYIFSQALFPVLSKIAESTKEKLTRAVQKSIDLTLFVGFPIAIILYSFSSPITNLLFGLKEYQHSVEILKIFSIGLLLVYIDFILGSTVLATDKHKFWSIIAGIAILVNMGLNYFFIPYSQIKFGNGGIGAAVATILTELFIMVSAILLLKGNKIGRLSFYFTLQEITGAVFMYISIYLLNESGISWIIQAAIGLLVYLTVLLIFYVQKKGKEVFSIDYLMIVKDFFSTIIFRGEAKA